MTCLYIVPTVYLRNFRRSLPREDVPSLVMTLPGLVAQILKEGLVSYREDKVLEEVAVWQTIQDHGKDLQFFAPIAHYPGFVQELKWLFRQVDLGEPILAAMSGEAQSELGLLHDRYQQILNQYGILPAASQMKRAVQLAEKSRVLSEVTAIKVQGLGELSPLEQQLLDALARDRSLELLWPEVPTPVTEVQKASDPVSEVQMMGEALRHAIEYGVPLDQLAVAFPNPGQYLPILIPVFEQLKIPWRVPEVSLRNTPLGKTLLTTLLGALQGWHKHHLELLTAPGWGFPFGLTAEEHRLLRLAPPLKGLPAWRDYLGPQPGWQQVLELLATVTQGLVAKPLREYGLWLENFLGMLQPELWALPEENLESWAELVKAWDGLQSITESLQQCAWVIAPEQFVQLMQVLLDGYQIQGRRVFAERVQVLSVEQLGAYTYQKLMVGGLVEGQFPPRRNAHWLTKAKGNLTKAELYRRLSNAAQSVYLFYPEVDKDGKLNLPATILPKTEEETKQLLPEPAHYPSLFFGKGRLKDEELLVTLRERVLQEGLSVSQLNRYANCPYQFFCSYVLRLEPQEEVTLELDARKQGNLIHDVLQAFWQEHLEGPLPTLEDGQARIEGLVRQKYALAQAAPSSRLIRTMRDFIRRDLELTNKGFRPKYLEKRFQGLVIQTSSGPVVIRGRIDRIDSNSEGAYVLYDYKTGSAPQINAMVEGKDVQIAAYLLAARDILPQGQNVGAAYYVIEDRSRKGIFHEDYYQQVAVSKGKNVLDEQGFTQQNEKFAEILHAYGELILQGQFPIEPVSSRVCSFCAFQGICRREVGF